MSDSLLTTYDEIAYPCSPSPRSQPELIAALAALYGLDAAPPGRCRVLEIGCNNGANLIPMAAREPLSRFTGIDLAPTAIHEAEACRHDLNLSNLELLEADLTSWDPGPHTFDYVIAHGIYSWIPPEARQALLRLCASSLAPNGIAYISYNALPGCEFRRYIWDLLRCQTSGLSTGREKIAVARDAARKLESTLGDDPYHAIIKKELEALLEKNDSVLLHDDLSDHNTPFLLTEFTAQAEPHGLQYLSDADFTRDAAGLSESNGSGWLATRQFADFTDARRFRASLLCRTGIRLDRHIRFERVASLLAASPLEPDAAQPDGLQQFRFSDGHSLSTNDPSARRTLCQLASEWPGVVQVRDLPFWEAGEDAGMARLLKLLEAKAIELRVERPRLVSQVSERPAASKLVRYQLSAGQAWVTNQRHASVFLNDAVSRSVLGLLDGTRDRNTLLEDLTDRMDVTQAGSAWHGNGPATRLDYALMLDQRLDANLVQIARLGLLVA